MPSTVIAKVLAAQQPIKLASIAAILDKWGGWRVVVHPEHDFSAHVQADRDERAYVVPYAYVQSPPRWEQNAALIDLAVDHMNEVVKVNPCGTCRACCITLPWKEGKVDKPAHKPCTQLCNSGCKVYSTRPKTCQRFRCLWLASQAGNDPMPDHLRPDRCGVILTPNSVKDRDSETIEVHPHREGWQNNQRLQAWLDGQVAIGRKPMLVTHYDVVETT